MGCAAALWRFFAVAYGCTWFWRGLALRCEAETIWAGPAAPAVYAGGLGPGSVALW
jgi:hypothetical protein